MAADDSPKSRRYYLPTGQLRERRMEALAHLLASDDPRPVWPDLAREAGYTNQKGDYFRSSVLQRPHLLERIAELKGIQAAENGAVGQENIRDEVLASLRQNRERALKAGDHTAVNRANELIGKTACLFTDVVRNVDEFDAKTGEELEQILLGLLKDPIVRSKVRATLAHYDRENMPVGVGGSETQH